MLGSGLCHNSPHSMIASYPVMASHVASPLLHLLHIRDHAHTLVPPSTESPRIQPHWFGLGHVLIPEPITVARGMQDSDWPGLEFCPPLLHLRVEWFLQDCWGLRGLPGGSSRKIRGCYPRQGLLGDRIFTHYWSLESGPSVVSQGFHGKVYWVP